MRLLVLAVLVLCAGAPATAQTRAAVTGILTDTTGAAMAQESVLLLRHESHGTERRVVVTRGVFDVPDLAPGDYQITAESPGFAPVTRRLSLAAGASRQVVFALPVGQFSEDVVVTANQVAGGHEALRRLPGSVEILDGDTLRRSRVFTTNEALRKVPGLNVRDEEGFGMRPNIGIRGINPTRSSKVLLLEDGIPLTYAPYGDNSSYYHPPIERFDRIEVMKGGAQIAYGPQTVAGLINYVTPDPPAQPEGTIALTGGNRGYFNGQGSYGASAGRTGFLLDVTRRQGDGAREFTHSAVNDVNGKLVVRPLRAPAWTLRGNYFGEDSNVTYSGLRLDEFSADPRANPFRNDFFYTDRLGTSATSAVAFNRAALTTNVYFSSFRRHWWRQSSNSAQRPNDAADPACAGMQNLNTTCGNEGRLRQYYVWGVEPRVRVHYRALGVASETDLGLRLHYERQGRRQKNGSTPTARDGVLVEDNRRTNQAYATFVQNRFLFDRWTITPGARLEHVRYHRTNRLANLGTGVSGETTVTRVVPGIGVSHAATPQLAWFAGVHRGFAPPRTEDIVSNSGGVIDLDPELSWNYEAGLRSTVFQGIRVDATLFVVDYENQVVPASLAGGVGAAFTNGGATMHRGVEVAGRLDTAPLLNSSHNVYARIAYTAVPVARFSGTRFSSIAGFGSVSVSGNRLPYAPEHLATVGVGYMHPLGFDVMLEAVHTSEQFGDDLNTILSSADGQRGLLPAYTVWNTSVNYSLRRATLFMSVKNLFDDLFIVDRSRGILPGSPRLVHAGVAVRF